jgi:hypothetical protein
VNWLTLGSATSITRHGLSLASGTTYYFYVKAQNRAGLWSAAGASDGIMAVDPVSRISQVKASSPGRGFVLPEKIIAASTDGAVFLEEPDRSCAIRLNWSGPPPDPAAMAVAAGMYLGAVDNEPTAEAVSIEPGSPGAASPVGLANASIGWPGTGAPRAGVDTRGLLVRTWGTVTYAGPSFFVIDDGSGVSDWLSTVGVPGMKVALPAGASSPGEGRLVCATGISRASAEGRRWLMPRTAADIQEW